MSEQHCDEHNVDNKATRSCVVLDTSPFAAVCVDAANNVLRVNEAAEALLGWPVAEAVGRPFARIVGCSEVWSASPGTAAPMRVTTRGGTALVVRVWRRSGCSNHQSEAVYWILDVSEAARADRLHQRMLEVMSAIRGATAIDDVLRLIRDTVVEQGGFDRAGVFEVVGGTVRGAWGTDRDGQARREHGIVESLDDWGPSIDGLASGATPFVIEHWRPGAQVADASGPVQHVIMAFRAGDELVGLLSADNLISGRPITEADVRPLLPFAEEAAIAIRQTRLLEASAHVAAELERRVDERSAEAQRAAADLERLTRLVAHDMRAPLRAIDASTHILMEEADPALTPAARARLEQAGASARHLGALMDDLLTMARIGRRPLRMRAVLPANVARLAWEAMRTADPTLNAELRVDTSMSPVWADRDLLVEVYARLLSNAAKFTRGREAPAIEVGRLAEHAQGLCTLYVRDNGVGFEPEYAAQIFDPFTRLHPLGAYEGTGSGLAIVQRIVERHGGRVWAEAEVGKGATFYLTLPLAAT